MVVTDVDTATVIATYTGITGTSQVVPMAHGVYTAEVQVTAVRAGYTSFQAATVTFNFVGGILSIPESDYFFVGGIPGLYYSVYYPPSGILQFQGYAPIVNGATLPTGPGVTITFPFTTTTTPPAGNAITFVF